MRGMSRRLAREPISFDLRLNCSYFVLKLIRCQAGAVLLLDIVNAQIRAGTRQ